MRCSLFILAALLLVSSLTAQNIRVSIDEEPYYKGSPFTYRIIMENVTPDMPPQFAPTKDFSVQALQPQNSTNSQIYIINGKKSEKKTVTTTYPFFLTPVRTGRLDIPALTVTVGGKTQTIPAHSITVRTLDTNGVMTLSATVPKTVCAVGEPISISFTWTSKANIQGYQLSIPMLLQEGLDAEPTPLEQRLQNLRGATVLTANGDTRIPAFQSASNNLISVKFAVNIIPRKPGTYALQPATIIADIVDTSSPRRPRRNSFFDDPFFNDPFFGRQQYNTTKCAAETKPITLVVKEPPADKRPYSYTGLAEPCAITVTADKTDVYVGDPIVLSITLQGPRFPQSIILPKLSEAPAFKESFRIFDNDAPGQLNPNRSITFKRTVRATSTAVKEVPPIEITWFDAADGQYHSSASQPIPLDVKATKKATAISSEPQLETPAKVEVSVNASGPQGNFPASECIANQTSIKSASNSRWLMFLLLGLPPLLTLLLVAIRMTLRHRAANADSYRARGAAKNAIHALKRLEASNGHQAALTAIQTFVGDKLKRAPETLTQQDITAYLSEQSVSPTLIDCAKTLMDACEAAIYAKQIKLPADEACSQARELIIELDKVTR